MATAQISTSCTTIFLLCLALSVVGQAQKQGGGEGQGGDSVTHASSPVETGSRQQVAAAGADASQSDALTLELVRRDFDQAFSEPPFAAAAGEGPVLGSASGAGGNGPIVAVAGGVDPGRWYAVVRNGSGEPVSVSLRADVSFQGEVIEIHRGLWFPPSRSGQGFDYNWGGTDRARWNAVRAAGATGIRSA